MERCHNNAHRPKDYPCPGADKCPLGIDHPPNKPGVHGQVDNGFVIGCVQCFSGVQDFVLASDSSAQAAAANWEARFKDA